MLDYQIIAGQLRTLAPRGAMLRQDSRAMLANDIFVAFTGDVNDGRKFIDAAVKAGASAVLADSHEFKAPNSRTITVHNLKQSLGFIAHEYFGKPSDQLTCIGVTGTNGKTTVTYWLAELLEKLQGKPSALLGTLGAGLLGDTVATGLTTPHASDVQRFLAQVLSKGAGSACIEATSIGLEEGRLNGVAFRVAAFTNLTQDHLDYHSSMAAYGEAKRQLFNCKSLQTAVINIDDAFGAQLSENLQAKRPKLQLITTGLTEKANLSASHISTQGDASQSFTLHHDGKRYAAQLPALGQFNVANALTAAACCMALGYDLEAIVAKLTQLKGVNGRMQKVGDEPLTVVDFAHTPDGLLQALQALKPVALARQGKLKVIFGCGGNRDASKRPLMGQIAQAHANEVVVSNDNPRDEAPADIAAQITAGAIKATVILDRAQAIAQTILAAQVADVILIAGKGHETTQIVAGEVHEFSDALHARAALNARKAGAV